MKGFHATPGSAYVPTGTKRILERLAKQHGCCVSDLIREGIALALQRIRHPVPEELQEARPDLPLIYA